MRGEVKMEAHEVLEVEKLADKWVGMSSTQRKNELKKEWKEDCKPSKWKTGGIQNFNISICY